MALHSRALRRTVVLVVFALVLVAAGALYQQVATGHDLRRYPPPGQLIDVGGYRLHLVCEGNGIPTVVMDAGLGDSWLTWSAVQPVIARSTRVCAYDRAGLGYSDPGPMPRESGQIVAELHALLTNAHLSPPYVLVGHSFGGFNTRLFAYTYPTEVAGLVLVDPSHEDQSVQFPASFLNFAGHLGRVLCWQATRARFGIERILHASAADSMAAPTDQRRRLTILGYRQAWYRALCDEFRGFGTTSAAQVRNARRVLDIPLYVLDGSYLAQDALPGVSGRDADSISAVWHRLHRELASGSARGHLIIAERSSHYVQFDQPDMVVQAVVDAVNEVRRTCTLHASSCQLR